MPKENRAKYAILGFLSQKPMSGYDIKKFSEISVSHFWNEDYGHIYPTLKSLEAEGFASSELMPGAGRPDRKVYAITESGRKELARWLASDPARPNLRVELLLKVFFGSRARPEDLGRMLSEEARISRAAIEELERTRAHLEACQADPGAGRSEASFQLMSLRYGLTYYGAMEEWCRECIAALGGAE